MNSNQIRKVFKGDTLLGVKIDGVYFELEKRGDGFQGKVNVEMEGKRYGPCYLLYKPHRTEWLQGIGVMSYYGSVESLARMDKILKRKE